MLRQQEEILGSTLLLVLY